MRSFIEGKKVEIVMAERKGRILFLYVVFIELLLALLFTPFCWSDGEGIKFEEAKLKKDRIKGYVDKAKEFYKNENYKLAILESYKALLEDPDNYEIKDLLADAERKARLAAEKEAVKRKEAARKARLEEEGKRLEEARKIRLEEEAKNDAERKAKLEEAKRKELAAGKEKAALKAKKEEERKAKLAAEKEDARKKEEAIKAKKEMEKRKTTEEEKAQQELKAKKEAERKAKLAAEKAKRKPKTSDTTIK